MEEKVMETHTLIEWLTNISHKLKHRTRKEERSFINRMGDRVKLWDRTVQIYSAAELSAMYDQRNKLVSELHKRGVINEQGYADYILSEDPAFTPELIIT